MCNISGALGWFFLKSILFSRQSANEELTQGVVRLYLTASQYSATLSIRAITTTADSTPLLEIKDLDVDLAYANVFQSS